MKKKILFLIHDLGQGGAEKVLVNLVNNMDLNKFDVSVTAMFGGGVNEQYLRPEIHYRAIFRKMIPGNSHIMKLFSPKQLHAMFVKESYDVEVAYLEGPSVRVISGCENLDTKLIAWIHCTMTSPKQIAESFRNLNEAEKCYKVMEKVIAVSEGVRDAFITSCNYKGDTEVLYNTVESDKILKMSQESAEEIIKDKIGLIAVGTLKPVKGFDRLLRIVKRLHEDGYPIHLYILGTGPMKDELKQYIEENSMNEIVSLLGYQGNPYKYVSKCDLFVCSSLAEGFSTAATEALIVGTPVCTVEVSGMKEMLGCNSEFGVITNNNEEDLYKSLKMLLDDSSKLLHYKKQAIVRGSYFKKEQTVKDVEKMLMEL